MWHSLLKKNLFVREKKQNDEVYLLIDNNQSNIKVFITKEVCKH
jgi:hypothetical protein